MHHATNTMFDDGADDCAGLLRGSRGHQIRRVCYVLHSCLSTLSSRVAWHALHNCWLCVLELARAQSEVLFWGLASTYLHVYGICWITTHTHSHCIACALEVVSAIPSILCTARVQCAEKMWWLPITHAGCVMFHDRGTVGCNACWCDMTKCNPMLLRRRRHN